LRGSLINLGLTLGSRKAPPQLLVLDRDGL
jgi:hypothetical protein